MAGSNKFDDEDGIAIGHSQTDKSYNMVASSCDQSKDLSESARSSLLSSAIQTDSDDTSSNSERPSDESDYSLAESYDEEVANQHELEVALEEEK